MHDSVDKSIRCDACDADDTVLLFVARRLMPRVHFTALCET